MLEDVMLPLAKSFWVARRENPWLDFLIIFPLGGVLCLVWRAWGGAAILFGSFLGLLLVNRRMRDWPFARRSLDVPSLDGESGLWWHTASARSRWRFAALMVLVNVALVVLLIVSPETVTESPLGLAWAVLFPFIGFFLVREAIRAHRELRNRGDW
jgi:hypothetical protein